jgi:hypothetical protein
MTKYIEALNILAATGNENAAWAVACTDEGLLPTVTKVQWIEFAYANIERNRAIEAAYAEAY